MSSGLNLLGTEVHASENMNTPPCRCNSSQAGEFKYLAVFAINREIINFPGDIVLHWTKLMGKIEGPRLACPQRTLFINCGIVPTCHCV